MRTLGRASERRMIIAAVIVLTLSAFVQPQILGPTSRPSGIPSLNPPDGLASGTLAYATFLGGFSMEFGLGIAVDASGSAYVAGRTTSPNFPATLGAFQTTLNGDADAFVAKLSPDGSQVVWATFLGGSGGEGAGAVALDSSNNVFVAGGTGSLDFPTTPGAFDQTANGRTDAFVAMLSPDGSRLLWSTLLGGAGGEQARALAIGGSGNVYVTGSTGSPDFPVTPGAFDETCGTDGTCNWDGMVNHDDVFVTEISSDGHSLVWSTFLGAEGLDNPRSIVVDAAGFPVVAGLTSSAGFPATPGVFQSTFRGDIDAFIAKLSPGGSTLAWATFLGGSGSDSGFVTLDAAGAIVISGGTDSLDFPVTPGAYQTTIGGDADAFVGKMSSDGRTLVWATYLGGTGKDSCDAVPDRSGAIHVAGYTNSSDFPVTPDAFDSSYNGGADDAFVAQLDSTGSRLAYATFLGGSGEDGADHAVLDASGDVYVSGRTNSPDFPVTPGAFDTSFNGLLDAYVVKSVVTARANTPPTLSWTGEPSYVADGLDPEAGTDRTTFSYRVAYADADGDPPTQIKVKIEKPLGTPWGTFPMAFAGWVGAPNDYAAGAIYMFSTTLPAGTDFWYSFRATDGWDWATGPPTIPIDAPDVVADNPPVALAQASPTVAHMGDVITFDATGSTDDFGIVAYQWDFGDGANDSNSVITHTYASRGTSIATLTVWDASNQNDTDTVPISIENRQPIADAGPDQGVFKNDLVTLNGTGSRDPDGDPLTYLWNQTGGPSVVLAGADTATPTFSPATSDTYTFLLTVWDGWGGSSNDTVNVTVVNRVPIADAGPDQTIPKKTLVTLNGTGSSDPDGDSLTYAWTQTSGPAVILAGADTATPTVTPPKSGVYAFQLVVNDSDGGTSSDTVQVTATNTQPVADAGPDQTVRKNTLVTLDGSLSSDSDGDTLTFSWTQLSGPPVTLTGADTATPSFTPTKAGTCAFRLSVSDGDGGTSEDSTNVTVWGLPPNANLVAKPPSAHAGVQIEFDASGSSDPDGTIVDFAFSFGDNTSASGLAVVRNHSYAAPGTYTVTLTVTDDDGNVSTAQVTVEVIASLPPPEVETNYKPLVALLYAVILAVVGFWSSRKRPWKSGTGKKAVLKSFTLTSVPFILIEALTGVLSLSFEPLRIPPIIGWGTGLDCTILAVGILFLILSAARKGEDKANQPSHEP